MSVQTPPSPPAVPVVGHTHRFASDPFAFVEWARDEVGDVSLVSLLGGDLCYLTHPDHIERALVGERDAFGKTADFETAFFQGLLATEGEQWERQRDAVGEFFYPGRIRSYADRMVDRTERRIDRWADGETIPLVDELKALALENLFATIFDRSLDIDGDEEIRRAAADLNGWFVPSSWALPEWVPTPARRRFRRAVETLEGEARRLLAEREAGEGEDMLSTLAGLRASGETDLTDEEIVSQVATFVFAGHDTTGLAMTYALHLLSNRPAVRERFHAELDEVLDGARPTAADVPDLAVTERILREAIRLYPPVHTVPRVATRDVTVGGYRIPEGTETHLSLVAVQRDGRFWDDPRRFRPERWRDRDPQSVGFAYAPFGAGPRVCIGRRFALLEAQLALATIGRRYRLEPRSEIEAAPEMTTQPADDVPVRVHER